MKISYNVKNYYTAPVTKYQKICEDFLETDNDNAILEFEDDKEAFTYYRGLYAGSYKYGVRVKKRGLKVVLERVGDNGNRKSK